MLTLAWLVLFLPLAAAAAILAGTLRRNFLSSALACGAMTVSFLFSCAIFFQLAGRNFEAAESHVVLVSIRNFELEFGVLVDRLSAIMLLIVTGIGGGIFFYSTEYMKDDPGYSRYFAGLSLFAFSMLGIVLSTNFFQIFVFWELVGVSSYLLIGHWYQKNEAADAGKKAFITTRIGDVGFLIGILMVWSLAGGAGKETLNFGVLESLMGDGFSGGMYLTLACLAVFCGVLGKSAQFPLHVWLPDAMEGPTPVSALIHAATMVAAGVYLLARTFFLFVHSSQALFVIACTGCVTALMAALMALVQDDIKKVLAYSTLSQLGYMVMAVGLGSASAGMYHLVTHAFFKALLFLGAGSVIHAIHTQNIWEMGGLLRRLPVTGWTFLIGFLALAGIFPLSGFFSKDEILTLASMRHPVFYLAGTLTAFLTAFYMGRLFFTVFTAEPRREHHPHGEAAVIRIPLLLLAFFSAASGFFGLGHWLHTHHDAEIEWNFWVVSISLIVSLGGIAASYLVYNLRIPLPESLGVVFAPARKVLENKFYLDDFYDALVQKVQQNFAGLCDLFERWVVVEWMVNGTARVTAWSGDMLRRLQTGRIHFYALVFSAGITALVGWWVLAR
ncbi:MAG: NADH-quinone oxidoreductase subunit L [Candidatus Omnitrophica bacterium]|nr:NADH-quinone oxidoreductase subunit L [Candidatus Omnitrophota bacterium]